MPGAGFQCPFGEDTTQCVAAPAFKYSCQPEHHAVCNQPQTTVSLCPLIPTHCHSPISPLSSMLNPHHLSFPSALLSLTAVCDLSPSGLHHRPLWKSCLHLHSLAPPLPPFPPAARVWLSPSITPIFSQEVRIQPRVALYRSMVRLHFSDSVLMSLLQPKATLLLQPPHLQPPHLIGSC